MRARKAPLLHQFHLSECNPHVWGRLSGRLALWILFLADLVVVSINSYWSITKGVLSPSFKTKMKHSWSSGGTFRVAYRISLVCSLKLSVIKLPCTCAENECKNLVNAWLGLTRFDKLVPICNTHIIFDTKSSQILPKSSQTLSATKRLPPYKDLRMGCLQMLQICQLPLYTSLKTFNILALTWWKLILN